MEHDIGFAEHGGVGHKVIGWPGYTTSPCGQHLAVAYKLDKHIAAFMVLCKRCFPQENEIEYEGTD